MELQLRISGIHHNILKKHLLPDDGKEAVAVALCGRYNDSRCSILMIHDLILIPYDECYSREYDVLHWPTTLIIPYFERISRTDMAILKIHSHPGGYEQFSATDNESDHEFFDSVFGWSRSKHPHGSAVMLPEGEIFGRFFFDDLTHLPINKVSVSGDIIEHFTFDRKFKYEEFAKRTIQAFGEKTYQMLSKMSIGVVGCSGTGSPVIEQLVRLGIGKIVLIDPDKVELKNLNRIINSTVKDAENETSKVEMLSNAIKKIGLNTNLVCFKTNLYDSIDALKTLITCDLVFGCVDSVDGRYLLNQLCSFYLLPYFDLGVKLEADNSGGISQICGSVHYIQPGCSSLLTRGIFNMEDLKASSQLRKNPEEYENLKKNSYIKNINVNNPAVISVNMQVSSHAVNEFLNRIHPYKVDSPNNYAASTIDITEGYIVNSAESSFMIDEFLRKKMGRGDTNPFIEFAELSDEKG
jgi:hypothetical protein